MSMIDSWIPFKTPVFGLRGSLKVSRDFSEFVPQEMGQNIYFWQQP